MKKKETKYEVGEHVIIVHNEDTRHCFKDGQEVVVDSLEGNGDIYSCRSVDNNADHWCIDNSEVTKLKK